MLRAEVLKFPVLAANVALPPTDCDCAGWMGGWIDGREMLEQHREARERFQKGAMAVAVRWEDG